MRWLHDRSIGQKFFISFGVILSLLALSLTALLVYLSRINSYVDPVEARKNFVARQPMGRLAQAHEIAPIVVYLASDESVFATGQLFSIDGGMTI